MTKKKTEAEPKAKKELKTDAALERVKDEQEELYIKIEALTKFKKTKAYAKLSKGAQRLLRIQLLHMTKYAETLVERIQIW